MSRRNGLIDELRGVATLMIVIHHTPWGYFRINGPLRRLNIGVNLFFVVSGYLIANSLFELMQNQGRKDALTSFYRRRVFRILPSALVWVGISIAFAPFLGFSYSSAANELKHLITLTYNYEFPYFETSRKFLADPLFAPFWSLTVEEHFYLALPFLFLLLPKTRSRVYFFSTALLVLALWRGFVSYPRTVYELHLLYSRTEQRIDAPLMGVLLALTLKNRRMTAWSLTKFQWNGILWGGVALTVCLAAAAKELGLYYRWDPLVINGAFTALLFVAVKSKVSVGQSWTASVGRRCLSFYLINYPVFMFVLVWFGIKNWRGAAVYFALTFGLSLLNYRYLEAPLVRWGKKRESAVKIPLPRVTTTSHLHS